VARTPLDPAQLDAFERRAVRWMQAHCVLVMRIALGVVYLWFGVLKFFAGASPAEHIAGETMYAITFHAVPTSVSMPMLGAMESIIGIGLALGIYLRIILPLMAVQMSGTFLPLVLFPHESWTTIGTTPTLLGQYIIKNLVLISGGILIGATMRGTQPFDGERSTTVGEPRRPALRREVSGLVRVRRVLTARPTALNFLAAPAAARTARLSATGGSADLQMSPSASAVLPLPVAARVASTGPVEALRKRLQRSRSTNTNGV